VLKYSTNILCIETANGITSVAIAQDGICLLTKNIFEQNKAADTLHLLVTELLKETSLQLNQLNAIAISAGPGSYTGLRIAAAAAKGYCFALNIPLIAIPTLEAMVVGAKNRYQLTTYDFYFPMIDARRMEVFTSIFSHENKLVTSFVSLILDENFSNILIDEKKYCFFGNGANKLKHLNNFNQDNLFGEFIPSADDMCALAFQSLLNRNTEDIAYFEPAYFKAFHTTK
jgi:tRNA threonylcarbamoyladenosine biosynthesis protein TsaB